MPQLTIPILMYHQVDTEPPKGSSMRGLVVSPKTFARQMAALNALGYQGKSMGDLLPYLNGEKHGKVFGITFDDGYENNLRCALPILERYGFTSTCYIVANQVGKTNGWDKERGVIQVPLMTAQELQVWIDAGQEVGSHTLNHANLATLNQAEQAMEIVQSKVQLEALIQQKAGVQHFCYPYGGLNKTAVQCVKAAGYLTATTTVRGRAVAGQSDDLLLPRVLVSRTTTWMQLLLKCLSRYEDKRAVNHLADVYAL
ncbi:MAG: polysaccharide deacetylase family protein [Vitreoscilla sp.]|nr:polysaccharide deacetylase family protein [Polaromonas sp.]